MKYFAICLFAFSLVFSCKNEKEYSPQNLRKLTETELLERARNGIATNEEDVIYKNIYGQEISLDSMKNLPNPKTWIVDKYVNEQNEIKELILRKKNENDIIFQEKLIEIYQERLQQPTISIININCDEIEEILTKVRSLDQDMRNNNTIDPNIDRENLTTVVSLMEKCDRSLLKELNKDHISTIWLVFQHSDNYYRKKYFPFLKELAEAGALDRGQIALMEDRILMMDGKPQIYGSQVIQDNNTGKWSLYDLKNPESVDKRRLSVGLQPLREYLKHWDIKFDIKQKE